MKMTKYILRVNDDERDARERMRFLQTRFRCTPNNYYIELSLFKVRHHSFLTIKSLTNEHVSIFVIISINHIFKREHPLEQLIILIWQ